jgi:hypothetical protein
VAQTQLEVAEVDLRKEGIKLRRRVRIPGALVDLLFAGLRGVDLRLGGARLAQDRPGEQKLLQVRLQSCTIAASCSGALAVRRLGAGPLNEDLCKPRQPDSARPST